MKILATRSTICAFNLTYCLCSLRWRLTIVLNQMKFMTSSSTSAWVGGGSISMAQTAPSDQVHKMGGAEEKLSFSPVL